MTLSVLSRRPRSGGTGGLGEDVAGGPPAGSKGRTPGQGTGSGRNSSPVSHFRVTEAPGEVVWHP